MKFLFFLAPLIIVSCTAQSSAPSVPPSYISEAPLPEGWPQPGPYDRVSEKSYPQYRAAFTSRKGQSLAFFKLFGHIKKNAIPMTAPVEMEMAGGEKGLKMASMAFLYQSGKIGTAGPAGDELVVRDIPASRVLTYTWQGKDSKANIAKAKKALETVLRERKISDKPFRLFGYNGPGTPSGKRTWELQALLK